MGWLQKGLRLHRIHIMLAKSIFLISVLASVWGAPAPQYSQYLSYLPATLQTLEEGREVVYDLYDDVKEEVVEPLAPQVTNMMATASRVMGQLNAISDKVDKIMMRKKLTEEEMEEVEAKIAELQSEIEEDKMNDEKVDDQFEMMIQTTLTTIREMMVDWTRQDKLFFNNLAKVEEEFYNINQAVANGSGDMKSQIANLFETLRSIDLNRIGDLQNETEPENIPRTF